jgi:hypothetical protein
VNAAAGGALAVFVQVWSPRRAYRSLLEPRGAVAAAIAAGMTILAVSAAPLLSIPGTPGEVMSLRAGPGIPIAALPLLSLLERCVVAVTAGVAAWGVARASGRRSGLVLQIGAAWLAQPVYILAAVAAGLLLDMSGAPAAASAGPALLLGQPPADPSALTVMLWLLLSMLDIPSILCLTCWGLGMASLEGRPGVSGMATAFSLYVLAILLLAVPMLSASSG